MKTLVYEDANIETKYSYAVYRYSGSKTVYLVYECDPDGHTECIKEFTDHNEAVEFARNRCR